MSDTPPFPWFRALVFVGLSAAMAWGTVSNLVLERPYDGWFKPWRMYFGHGTQLCEVRYIQIARTGQERVLNRYQVLGYQRWTDAPPEIRNLPDGPTIGRVARKMCRRLPAEEPEIRAEARCASVSGWHQEMNREIDLCTLTGIEIESLDPQPGTR